MKHSSFVLKVSCPFDVRCFGEQDVPFARQTMLTIDRALRQLVSAIEADSLQEFVEDAKVTANQRFRQICVKHSHVFMMKSLGTHLMCPSRGPH